MSWILIFYIHATYKSVITVTTATFETEAACQAAGSKSVTQFAEKYVQFKFTCSRSN